MIARTMIKHILLLAVPACGGPAPPESVPPSEPTSSAVPANTQMTPAVSHEPTATPRPAAPSQSATLSSGSPVPTPEPAAAPAPPRCPEGMALVDGGEFQRAGAKESEAIADLCFDVLETTVADYAACVEQGSCGTEGLDCSAQSTYGQEGKADHPVVCIDFDQANAYCAFKGKRVPTLAEWEWAARGGEAAFTYPWGNEAPDDQVCWTGKRRQTETCPVGTFAAGQSKHGIFNMGGNVLEFVTTPADDKSPVRIAKGGAWNGGDPGLFKNSRVGGFKKEYRCGFLGVRCVHPARLAGDAPDAAPTGTGK